MTIVGVAEDVDDDMVSADTVLITVAATTTPRQNVNSAFIDSPFIQAFDRGSREQSLHVVTGGWVCEARFLRHAVHGPDCTTSAAIADGDVTLSGDEIRISKNRFEAFSDGVFAIAITLLVLGFQPPKLAVVTAATMSRALVALWPQYLVYGATFLTIGIMWFNHYALFHHVRHITYGALVGNLCLLLFIAFLPFPTMLLGLYGLLSTLVFLYGLMMLLISACYGALYYVVRLRPGERGSIMGFVRTRSAWNTLGPIVYFAAMVLAFISPLTAILLVVAIAVFYMLPTTVRSALAAGATGSPESSELS